MNGNWREGLKRGLAGFLAFIMAGLLVLGDAGTALAARRLFQDALSLWDEDDISGSAVDEVTFENQEMDGVLISVSSETSDFRPGEDVTLDIYVKNETDQTITGGTLSYEGNGIQKNTGELTLLGKVDVRELLARAGEDGFEAEDMDLIWDLDEDSEIEDLTDENDWEWEEDIEAERDGITLEPGEIYVAQFEYVVDKSVDKKTAEGFQIDFRFEGIGEDEDSVEAEETFSFTVNYLNVAAPFFEDGNLVKTGETVTMGIHADLSQVDSILTDSWEDASPSDAEEAEEDAAVATPSQASAATSSAAKTATASNATASTEAGLATPSQAGAAKTTSKVATTSNTLATTSDAEEADPSAEEELIDDRETILTEVDLNEIRYEIEMYNAKLNGFKVKKAMVDDAEDNMLVCTYRVSNKVEPGVYFGKVTQISESNGDTYESTQGFALIVEGEGEITLEGSLGDTTVTVTGPVDAFPDVDELEVRVSELDDEIRVMMEEEIQKKAEELGENVRGYILMDVSLYADGVEIQPEDSIEVTFEYNPEELKENASLEEEAITGEETAKTTTRRVFHFNESEQAMEVLEKIEDEEGKVVVNTSSFSPVAIAEGENEESGDAFSYTNGNITATVAESSELTTALSNYATYQFKFDILITGDNYNRAISAAEGRGVNSDDSIVVDMYFSDDNGNRIEVDCSTEIELAFTDPIYGAYGLGGVLEVCENDSAENILETLTVNDSLAIVKMMIEAKCAFSENTVLLIYPIEKGDTGELLDGDYAYLTDVKMVDDASTVSGKAMRTGTADWDDDDDAGNDSNELNNILRTYDIATYTITFTSRVRDEAPYKFYKSGKLNFEFILQVDGTKAQFETDSMVWLAAKDEVSYEITEKIIDGITCQVLRGSYLWKPDESKSSHAIGESTQELNLAVRALAMQQGDTLTPTFTFWLEGNEVPDLDSIVTGSDQKCSIHKDKEYQTITAPTVTISARPMYNVKLAASSATYQYVQTYDFSTGYEGIALNKDVGSLYGRLAGFGITIQVAGKTGQGLRGVELPMPGEDITLQLNFTSTFTYSDKSEKSQVYDATDTYTPLVWSLEGHSYASSQEDGRTIPSGMGIKYVTSAPFNAGASASATDRCYKGGTWRGVQNGSNVSITVSGCEVMMSLDTLPYRNGYGNVTDTTYYDPDAVKDYWDIQYACISAGELWVVQPFYRILDDGSQEYILDELETSDGSFLTIVQDVALSMKSVSGETLKSVADNSNQTKTSDDRASMEMEILKPGTIDYQIQYKKYPYSTWNDPITEGAWGTGKDWILKGNQAAIFDWLVHDSAEGEYTDVGYDQLIKFDDVFFEPDVRITASNIGGNQPTKSYAAKPDGMGWNHADKDPDEEGYDEEMIQATIEDLVYFSTLDELESSGYTCVGVLIEYRGLASLTFNHTDVNVVGTTKTTAKDNQVYMVTHYGRAWNRAGLAEKCVKEGDLVVASEILTISDEELSQYINKYLPTRGNKTLNEQDGITYTDYANSSYIWGNGGNTSISKGILNYQKAYYDESGCIDQTAGTHYGDSCLTVGYTSEININVAQTTSSGEKKAFDMDTAQRYVDYVLWPTINLSEITDVTSDILYTTIATITVTLPEKLTYLEGTSYWGGEYTQNGEGVLGTVTGGITVTENGEGSSSATLEVTRNDDGTTTLIWTLYDVEITGDKQIQALSPVYFSCLIGTAGIESTDVNNGDELLVTATIQTTEDSDRDLISSNGNYSENSIIISKNGAAALAKFADQSVVDAGSDMLFTMYMENNSMNPQSIIAVDSIPYEKDGVSSFIGECLVRAFSIEDFGDIPSNIAFYYTLNEAARGKESSDYESTSFTESDSGWIKILFPDDSGYESYTGLKFQYDNENESWVVICYDEENEVWTSAIDMKIVSIVAVGTLPASKTLTMHESLYLPAGTGGNYVVGEFTNATLSSSARCRIVNRILEGLTWIDTNADGIQDLITTGGDEELANGVQVCLYKLSDSGSYEPVYYNGTTNPIIIKTGHEVDVLRATSVDEVTIYENGQYRFSNLSAGTYAVKFTTGTGESDFKFQDGNMIYWATAVNQGSDDTKDSDAVGSYDATDKDILEYTVITAIDMPAASTLTYSTYTSGHHDSGFYQPVKRLRVVKYVIANDEDNEPIPSNYKFLIDINQVSGSDEVTISNDYTTFALGTTEDISRYINLDGEKGGTTFKLEEIVPMEYSLKEMIWIGTPETETEQKALTVLLTEDNGNRVASQVLSSYDPVTVADNEVTIYPGDDITVVLTNQPKHTSYFHHTASVTNGNTTKGTSGFKSIEEYDEDKKNSESTTSVTTLSMADVKIVALVDYRTVKRRMDDQEGGDWNEAI